MVLAGKGSLQSSYAQAPSAPSLEDSESDATLGGASQAQAPPSGVPIERFVVSDPEDSEKRAAVMLWRLRGSFFAWAGPAGAPPVMPHLVAGLVSRFEGSTPFASTVCELGGVPGQAAHGMAQRLAKRLDDGSGSVVHVSCAIGEGETSLRAAVETELARRMTQK